MTHQLRLALIALQFLTRVPVPRSVGYAPQWLNDSARYFPLIGLFVGAVGAGVLWLSSMLFAWPLAVGLSMVATIVLTGAFHEDGFADVCDALCGAVDRAKALAIMKDSRLGTYGVAGLTGMLGLKALALSQLAWPVAGAALLLAHALSRAVAVGLMRWLPYAGDVDASKAKPMAQGVSARTLGVAWLWPAFALLVIVKQAPWLLSHAVVGLCAALAVGVLCARWFRRRLGGITGDCLGATQQLAELALYLAWVARW